MPVFWHSPQGGHSYRETLYCDFITKHWQVCSKRFTFPPRLCVHTRLCVLLQEDTTIHSMNGTARSPRNNNGCNDTNQLKKKLKNSSKHETSNQKIFLCNLNKMYIKYPSGLHRSWLISPLHPRRSVLGQLTRPRTMFHALRRPSSALHISATTRAPVISASAGRKQIWNKTKPLCHASLSL